MSVVIAIVGSRTFKHLDRVARYINTLSLETKIISGGARGVDRYAATVARARGLNVEEYLAQWETYGKSAGYRRNSLLVEKADRIVAFWDGISPGTKHTIDIAQTQGKPYEVILDD